MFNKNDKSMFLLRKIINVVLFVLMCASVIAGIVLIAVAFNSDYSNVYGMSSSSVNGVLLVEGILTLVLGPILLQIVWLIYDMKFQSMLDIKIIRNAQFNQEVPELPAGLFCKKFSKVETTTENVYETLKKYKNLLDENIITNEEFNSIKKQLLGKEETIENQAENTIEKVKQLKAFADEKILTDEEFSKEKSKLLGKK